MNYTVCRPVQETAYKNCTYTVCRPVQKTCYRSVPYTVQVPVQTTVLQCQPYTTMVPVRQCGLQAGCLHGLTALSAKPSCGNAGTPCRPRCRTVLENCSYTVCRPVRETVMQEQRCTVCRPVPDDHPQDDHRDQLPDGHGNRDPRSLRNGLRASDGSSPGDTRVRRVGQPAN